MSTIITRPAFEGPHPLATSAPGALAMREAQRTFDMATQALDGYVASKSGHLACTVLDNAIALFWDGVYSGQVPYGEWAKLDARINEVLARHTPVKKP